MKTIAINAKSLSKILFCFGIINTCSTRLPALSHIYALSGKTRRYGTSA